ncbi:kinase-like domain-containing protein [Suillus paluster]|uniref:kinase-like domain-containing protein n=1 Tax=Suillus paluster TaxID=48578 RepID=UPI001B885A2E|nr:kinase-like domain-containing protein [Suillus paluster]KAG1726185.1 kinase-like domain-containing protein [Suillus paluster]
MFTFTVDGQTFFNPVVHRDLTGTNVLISSDGTAYLADFGLSGTLTKSPGMTYLAKMSCHPGAMWWTAPELLSGEDSASAITTQSDMYSFGSIMLQVLTGSVPWRHLTNDTAILLKVIEGEIHPRPDNCCVTDQCWNLMTRCWSKSPIDRPSAEEVLQFVNSELALYICGDANGGRLHPALVPVPKNAPPLVGPSPSLPTHHAESENYSIISSGHLLPTPDTMIHSTPTSSISSDKKCPNIAPLHVSSPYRHPNLHTPVVFSAMCQWDAHSTEPHGGALHPSPSQSSPLPNGNYEPSQNNTGATRYCRSPEGYSALFTTPPTTLFPPSELPFLGLDCICNYGSSVGIDPNSVWQTFDAGAFGFDPELPFTLGDASSEILATALEPLQDTC